MASSAVSSRSSCCRRKRITFGLALVSDRSTSCACHGRTVGWIRHSAGAKPICIRLVCYTWSSSYAGRDGDFDAALCLLFESTERALAGMSVSRSIQQTTERKI
jgi:hypothetical protein